MLLPTQQTLQTNRLTLSAFTPEVYEYAFTQLSQPGIMQLFGHQKEEEFLTEKERYDKGMVTFNKSFLFFQLRDKNTGQFLGWCGYHTWYFTHYRAEVFYMLADDQHKKKGLMTEALLAVLNYGFNQMELQRVEAFVGEENAASLALLNKFGFVQEGCFRKHYHVKGTNLDSLAFGLLKEEHLSKQNR